jgi:hypothetical protein
MTNPAALEAALSGDFANAMVASTPGGIEAQEKAGQASLVKSTNMPKDLSPSREAFENLGFVFGDDVDDLFVSATLPAGWTRAATDHSMHSDILDEKGRKRVGVFYKAAFYDRKASAHLVARFRVEKLYPETGGAIDRDALLPTIITDAGVEIHRVGESKYLHDWEKSDRLEAEASKWLDENRAGWRNPVQSWSI